jgi:hypothetical protein
MPCILRLVIALRDDSGALRRGARAVVRCTVGRRQAHGDIVEIYRAEWPRSGAALRTPDVAERCWWRGNTAIAKLEMIAGAEDGPGQLNPGNYFFCLCQ